MNKERVVNALENVIKEIKKDDCCYDRPVWKIYPPIYPKKCGFIWHNGGNRVVFYTKDMNSLHEFCYVDDNIIQINLENEVTFEDDVIYNCANSGESRAIGYVINWFLKKGYEVIPDSERNKNSWLFRFRKRCC